MVTQSQISAVLNKKLITTSIHTFILSIGITYAT